MLTLPLSSNLSTLEDKIRETILHPSESFQAVTGGVLPTEFVGDYSDAHLPLTLKNQQTVVSTLYPALHEVDNGNARIMTEDESNHLVNCFISACGSSHLIAGEEVRKFSDSLHSIYAWGEEGLSFDIVSQENSRVLAPNIYETPAPTDYQTNVLRLNQWNLSQSSSLELSPYFNTHSSAFPSSTLEAAYYGPLHCVLTLDENGGFLELNQRNPISLEPIEAPVILCPFLSDFHHTNFLKVDCETIFIAHANKWWVRSSPEDTIEQGSDDRVIQSVVPWFFSGIHGWLMTRAGDVNTPSAGVVEGGSLDFVGLGLNLTIKTYVMEAPGPLYADGKKAVYVGVTAGNGTVTCEGYNSGLKLFFDESFTTSVGAEATIGGFFTRNGSLFAIVSKSIGGGAYSPTLIDVGSGTEIAFTTQQVLPPSLVFTPAIRVFRESVLVVDFLNSLEQTGIGIVSPYTNESCVGALPQSGFFEGSRVFHLTFDNNYDLVPIQLASSDVFALDAIWAYHGRIFINNSGNTYKLQLISSHNKVLPVARFVRLQSQRLYPSPFTTRVGASRTITLDGIQWSVGATTNDFHTTGGHLDVVWRNGSPYAVEHFSNYNFASTRNFNARYRLWPLTSPTSATLPNFTYTSPSQVGGVYDSPFTIGGISYMAYREADLFNVEDDRLANRKGVDRAQFTAWEFTKRLSTLDVGVVLKATRFEEKPQVGEGDLAASEVYFPTLECSSIEFNIDFSADNATLTLPRYRPSNQAEFLFRAVGTSDFPGAFEPSTQSHVDILSFGSPSLTSMVPGLVSRGCGITRLFSGFVENVETSDSSATVKLVGVLETVGMPYRDTVTMTCPYKFGGRQCGVSLTKTKGRVDTAANTVVVVEFTEALPLPVERYSQGTLRFMSKGFQNVEVDVASVVLVFGTTYEISLLGYLSNIPDSDTLCVLANGCEKTLEFCNYYGNLDRGRMLPYLQGQKTYTASGMIEDGI